MWTVSTSTSEARDVDSVNIRRTIPSVSTYHHGNLREELVRTAVALAREKGEDGRRAARGRPPGRASRTTRRTATSPTATSCSPRSRWPGCRSSAPPWRSGSGPAGGGSAADRARKRLRELGPRLRPLRARRARPLRCRLLLRPRRRPRRRGPYALLGEALDGLVAAGAMDPAARPGAETVCWSAVHGFSLLHLDGPLRHLPAPRARGRAGPDARSSSSAASPTRRDAALARARAAAPAARIDRRSGASALHDHREDQQRDRPRRDARRPRAPGRPARRPAPSSPAAPRGPPYGAFGEPKRHQASIASRGSSHTSSHRGEAVQPQTPNAAMASSSSTNTSASTVQPRATTTRQSPSVGFPA